MIEVKYHPWKRWACIVAVLLMGCILWMPVKSYGQFIHAIEYKIDQEKLNILYLMDPVPAIHKPGWTYNLNVKVEGKVLGSIRPVSISGDYLRVTPNEFQKMVVWEVDHKDESSLTDNLKVSLTLQDMEGPKAALKSLLIPGTGLKFVTGRNQVGLLRTVSVYAFLAGGVVTRLMSRGLYDNYLNAEGGITYLDTYGEANLMHQVSLICFASGIGIWAWDVINTSRRGRQNLKHLYKPVKVTPIAMHTGGAGLQLNWRMNP